MLARAATRQHGVLLGTNGEQKQVDSATVIRRPLIGGAHEQPFSREPGSPVMGVGGLAIHGAADTLLHVYEIAYFSGGVTCAIACRVRNAEQDSTRAASNRV